MLDALVIGAGPAGLMAAEELARAGRRVLRLGSEFVPRLSEGAIVINVIRLTGTDLADTVNYNTKMEQAILGSFPDEVAHVWSRQGAPEVVTDSRYLSSDSGVLTDDDPFLTR